MYLNLEHHRREYFYNGATLIPEAIDAELIRVWRQRAFRLASSQGLRRDLQASKKDVLGDGGDYHYRVFDGLLVQKHWPEMLACYRALVGLVSAVTLENVRTSPYERSAVNVLMYQGNNDQQSWHFDTNRISALLYLTTNTQGGTECQLLTDNPHQTEKRFRTFLPQEGALLLMQGRKVWHRGCSVQQETKVVCLWNYYAANDTWRPEGIDELLYGNVSS